MQSAPPRSAIERRSDTLELLESGYQLWLSTSSPEGGPHVIPVAFVWNGSWITMATFVQRPRISPASKTLPADEESHDACR